LSGHGWSRCGRWRLDETAPEEIIELTDGLRHAVFHRPHHGPTQERDKARAIHGLDQRESGISNRDLSSGRRALDRVRDLGHRQYRAVEVVDGCPSVR
jgi:hypothetical protein